MNVLDAIHTRRSIRRFTADPVGRDQLMTLIQAAVAAPSAGNEQPWHFIVVTDRALLDGVPDIHQYAAMSRQAQAAVLLLGDPGLEKYPGFWVQDLSAATQNLLLAAHGTGLGAVWCGIYPDAARVVAFRKMFKIPESVIPFAYVPIGFPAEPKERVNRFDPARVRENSW